MSLLNISNYDNKKLLVAPSLLAADFAHLADETRRIESAGCELLHLDVMDGHFVPNLTIGPPVIKSLRKESELIFDTHLMITNPLRYVEPFVAAGSDHITFHVECDDDIREVIAEIRKHQVTVGMSLKPATPAEALFPYLSELDMVLVMTVEPGFGGQSFMGDMMGKVRKIREKIDSENFKTHLQVDGGIDRKTVLEAAAAGANVIVAGTSVFRSPDGADNAIAALRNAQELL